MQKTPNIRGKESINEREEFSEIHCYFVNCHGLDINIIGIQSNINGKNKKIISSEAET